MSTLVDTQGWDDYWNKKNRGGLLYALVAAFYRKVIIRPNLTHFVRKYFPKNAKLLHAGCGSGQVDTSVTRYASVTALDISQRALEIYGDVNQGRCELLHGSIFSIPLPDGSREGIYNLGVMEHFSQEEIQKILAEFHRVLAPKGKLILFWPPEYGVSVLFFKTLVRLAKLLTGKDVKFHPDEISRLKDKEQAIAILKSANFKSINYSFGIRDVWTYAILVAERV